MKTIIKFLNIFVILFTIFWISISNAAVNFSEIDKIENITNNSISINNSWNFSDNIKDTWFSILTIIKYIISWVLIIFIVYLWIKMILSMWTDEESLSSSKRQIRYTMIWLVFINIPFSIYSILDTRKTSVDWGIWWNWSSQQAQNEKSLLIDTPTFDRIINWWIITFIEATIFAIAIFIIITAGLKILTSRWREENISEAKNKIVWSIIWLIFIWFIEVFQALVYSWKMTDWEKLFETVEKLALFFAAPIWIIFVTIAWYYYITAAWDEEKVKKAKNIIINILIATVILVMAHTFLKDLIKL